ncbi:unnamed protein product [Callosobruchus maculatus]|uniref:Uncharacterized protein n=1 Tax=Callosobruchus maculatus TaxID=64391 RepID=A0A653CUF4_CALMS|nr:unnamed protein product [Callosobruchus maculatus]
MLPSTISAICDMSTQTENLYAGLFTRKPEMAVISTQTAVKTTAFATQTEHKYVSLSTQTDRDDSVSKCIDNSVQNNPTASDEESISDILSEMKNIPRLLSPITDMFDVKIPVAKKTIVKRSINFANRNWKRVIHTSSLSTQKYLPWKRRMISKHIQSNTVQDSVAKALQILKRAKINFTISNETILPQGILAHPRYYCSQQVLSQNQPVGSKNNFVEKLSCSFSNCATNYSHMMLNNRDGCTELLGFFKGEKESTTQTKVDIVSHITTKKSSPDLVDETAKIVISKLKKEFSLIPKKRRMRSISSSDSDISEFEKSGLNAERAVKKIKRFQSINHRQYRQTEESTSGFESCSTPLTQYSTQDSQRFGENPLEKSLDGFSPNLQSIETPLSPLSDISINQISVSKLSMNPSRVDCESQVINQYDVHPNSHRNEEIIGCHMKTPLNDGVPDVSKPKCDFKLPQPPTKYEEGQISSSETRTCTEKPPRKKKKPMGKLKSKTLRQFKEKMLIYQTKHSRAASDCKRTIENERINENPTQKKFISEATTNTLAEIKSHNGKKHDLMENKLNASKIAKSKQCKKGAKVNDEDGVAKEMPISVNHLKLDSNACGMQEKQPEINMDKKYDKNINNSGDNIGVSNKVHVKNNKSSKLSANKRQLCQPEFDTATRNSKNSLNCDAPLKNGTDIDSLQNLYSPVSINQYVEPQSKLLKTIEKVEHQETINSVDYKNEKSFDKCYTSDQLVKGVIQPDTDSSLKDLDGAVDNKAVSRRRSQRLMKLEVSSSAIVQTSSKEFLNVTNNSTEVSGTNSTEKNELEANVDINCDLDIKAQKNDLDIKSVVQTDLPQVSLCDVMASPASPEHFPEPEDYSIKIIPLYPIETINNTQNMLDENYIEDKIQQVDNETSFKKNPTQTKFQVGKRLRKGVIKRSTKKKINVLQNVVIHPAKTTSVGDNEGDKFGPCDIMSKIMDDMDKNKLSITKKNPDIRNARTANLKLDDKEWRRMILDVAQLIHCDDEMLNFDLQPVEVPTLPQTYLKKRSLLGKADMLIKKLKVSNESENIRDELILEFKRFPPETVVNFILYGLTNDNENTLTKTYHPLLLVTKLQWLFLKLMTQLEQANMRNIFELYLQTAERLFYRYCSRARVVPLTRLYVAICKLHGNVNRVRKLCCEAFYYMENLAVILLHTVLLSWIEIFPMHDNMKCFPIAEVMVQLIHFKKIKNRQHKLYPLKALLNQYYGYPEGPLNCDEFFGALVRKYLCNPVRMLNFAIRLYCKYKDTIWLKKTINQIFKPLVYKIPEDNKEFKATVIVLLANISEYLKISSSDKYRVELEAWFSSLSEGDTPQMIQHSVEYALNKLSITTRWQKRRKKPKSKKKKSLKLSQRNGNS